MTDRPAPWPQYSPETTDRIRALVEAGAVFDYAGAGPVAELEGRLRDRYDAPYALTLNSGTSAVYAALAGAGVGQGDEVVIAGWTFLAAMTPLLWLGAVPVMADVADDQPVATVETVRSVLTRRTRAVVVTHLFGEPVDTRGLREILAPAGIALIEDCSHAHASVIGGHPPGFHANAAIFSLGARKIVSGGHGGALITRDRRLYETALMIGHCKPRTRAEFSGTALAPVAELALGGNLRMSPLSALLALDHLARLDELSDARVQNARILREAFGTTLLPLRSTAPGENGTLFDLVWLVPEDVARDRRDDMIHDLRRAGVPAGPVSTRPLSRTLRSIKPSDPPHSGRFWPELEAWALAEPELPVAERLHDRAISLASELFWQEGAPFAHRVAGSLAAVAERGGLR